MLDEMNLEKRRRTQTNLEKLDKTHEKEFLGWIPTSLRPRMTVVLAFPLLITGFLVCFSTLPARGAGYYNLGAYIKNRTYPLLIKYQGAVAYWKLDETSGTTSADSSGNGFTGTYTGGYTLGVASALARDPTGRSLALAGTNGWVNFGNNKNLLKAVPGGTISAWIKPLAFAGAGLKQCFFGISVWNATPVGASRITMCVKDTKLLESGARAVAGETQSLAAGTTVMVAGTWYHVAAVADYANNKIKAYVNGILETNATGSYTATVTENNNSSSVALGAEDDGLSAYFNGNIDEAAVFNRMLSDAEIKAQYTAGK